MSRDGATVKQGIVEEVLPQGLYRVGLPDGKKVTVSLGGPARQATVRVIAGDKVMVSVSELDPTRGKIKQRLS